MRQRITTIVFFLAATIALFFMLGCVRSGRGGDKSASLISSDSLNPRYAEGFGLEEQGGVYLLTIKDPEKESHKVYRFALVPKGMQGSVPEGYQPVSIPVERVVCMTTLQLSNFIALGQQPLVAGITSTRYLRDSTMKEQLSDGRTNKIGIEGNFDREVVMSLQPDLILISPFKRGGYDVLEQVSAPLVPHLGYKELTPLGQAEWVKVIGLLTGHYEEACRIFSEVESRYLTLKGYADKVSERPVVFSGEMRGGNWYAVGGKSYLAQQIRDAGGEYFLRDDEHSGGVSLDFETVYSQSDSARFWRILNSYPGKFSYDALKAEDARYADFKAFREKGVIYCNLREAAFYELMPMHPDWVLADLMAIMHPSLLPDHQPHFYYLLR